MKVRESPPPLQHTRRPERLTMTSKLKSIEFVGGGPLDGESFPVSQSTAGFEQWFVDAEGVARRGVYQIDRAAKPVVMRWVGYEEDAPLQDPVEIVVKVPGMAEPLRVEYEREIAEWLAMLNMGQGRVGVPVSEWFVRQVRSQVIAAIAGFSAMSGYAEVAGPEAETLMRAQIEREAREEIVPVAYIALVAEYANQSDDKASRQLRTRAIQYLRSHPGHARRMAAPELLAAMEPWRAWVRGVLTEVAKGG